MLRTLPILLAAWLLLASHRSAPAAPAADVPARSSDLAAQLRALDPAVLPADKDAAKARSRMVADDLRSHLRAAAERENEAWGKVRTRADWEAFRDARIRALRDSHGMFAPTKADLRLRVTGTIRGEGYRIENLVYETRPGLFATANLYLPAERPASMPAILLSHSHHSPKTQGELQDMGVTWARLGCAVLAPDHVGHGERRQHPFVRAEDYPKKFKVDRQDYYFRYNEAAQLHLAGESLMGWMVRDLMRGVDVLLTHAGADKDRVALIGAVAGGGDPAGVAAALEPRIAVVAPFNFGGPQPDYPIPPDAERDFQWFGEPWWESTRCLARSAQGGFAHWTIVAAVAPRKLAYSYEFGWTGDRDPAFRRIQKVFELYDAAGNVGIAAGKGTIKGGPPENTHCNNVGAVHRAQLYPLLERWLGIKPPATESNDRHTAAELACLTPAAIEELKPKKLHEVAAASISEGLAGLRRRVHGIEPKMAMRMAWAEVLGKVDPAADAKVASRREQRLAGVAGVAVERVALEVEPGIVVPMVLLVPPLGGRPAPVVVMVAQEGKQRILRERSDAIDALLAGGVAVCLPDVRGTGETGSANDDRGRTGSAADLAQSSFMLGRTLLGDRVRDLRSVLRYLRTRPELDAGRVGLWGDSFAAPNPAEMNLAVPADADLPTYAEPLGELLVLFGMLFEDGVRAGYARGGLVSFESCLGSPFCYAPADVIVPHALAAGDLSDLAAILAPRALMFDGLVDGLNCAVNRDAIDRTFALAKAAYAEGKAADQLTLGNAAANGAASARWILLKLGH